MASLSVDRILFGDVPLFSKERKILFVKNNSNEHKISFNWHVTTPEHVKVISCVALQLVYHFFFFFFAVYSNSTVKRRDKRWSE